MIGSQQQERLRVLELAEGVGGAVCGRLLAGLGHDVVKCEPSGGDHLRRQVLPGGTAPGVAFDELNAAKRSIERRGSWTNEVLATVAGTADVVIVDGTGPRGRLAAAELHRRFPGLLVVAVTTFGLDAGPDLGDGDSLLAEAFGGMANMIGESDRRPLALGGEQAAYAAGIVGFLGAMTALRRRTATGAGELVDVALCDVVAYMDWKSDVRFAQERVAPLRSGESSGRWRMVRASDGVVGVIFEPGQWNALVALIGDERMADPVLGDERVRAERAPHWWPAVEEWASRRTKLEVYEQAQGVGLPFGHAVTVAEVPYVEQFRSRGFVSDEFDGVGSPFGDCLPWSNAAAPRLGEHQADLDTGLWDGGAPVERCAQPVMDLVQPLAPLDGVTVLDLGTITAGAATSRILADYGATVWKVESPARPDAFRNWVVDTEDNAGGMSPLFDSNNAGKLGVALDLKDSADRDAFLRLVERADVLVENYAVGVTERLGIDAATLHRSNPDLIYVSLSSQGQRGPEATSRSYGSTLDLLSGLASVTGYDAEHPLWSSVAVNYPDQLASLFGASMAVYCLATGATGVHLDLAQREVVTWTIGAQVRQVARGGATAVPDGNARAGRFPHNTYRCAGGPAWLAVSCRTDAHRAALAAVVSPELAGHPVEWWLAHSTQVEALVARWAGDRSLEVCVGELAAAGVPAAPVLTADRRASAPRFATRQVFLDDGDRRLKGFPMVLHGYRPPLPAVAPGIGEHTAQVIGIDPAPTRRSYAGRLAAFVADHDLELPADVVDRAKLLVLDAIGCGLLGAEMPSTAAVVAALAAGGSGGPSSVWGTGHRFGPAAAALANGASVHAFELDDAGAGGHHGATAVTAALALAQAGHKLSGAGLLQATVAGVEVAARVAQCLGGTPQVRCGFQQPGVVGSFAAAAAAARVLCLDTTAGAHALSTAAQLASGLMGTQHGGMGKRLTTGWAAHAGVEAALLAAHGFTAADDVFECGYGSFPEAFSGGRATYDLSRLDAGLGEQWHSLDIGFKLWACRIPIHAALDALVQLRQRHQLDARDVVRVRVGLPEGVFKAVGKPYRPAGVAAAQLNLRYCVAVMLLDGDVFLDQFTEERIDAPDVLATAALIDVVHDPALDGARDGGFTGDNVVEVELRGGAVVSATGHVRGGRAHPATRAEIVTKFRKASQGRLLPAGQDRVIELCDRLEAVSDATQLCSVLDGWAFVLPHNGVPGLAMADGSTGSTGHD